MAASIYVEFLTNIQTVLVAIKTNRKTRKIIISSCQLSYLLDQSDETYSICNWNDTPLPDIITTSSTNLRYVPNEGIHVRFKTRPRASSWEHNVSEIITRILDIPVTTMATITMTCKFCQEQLLVHW